jgi:hypothetical protein
MNSYEIMIRDAMQNGSTQEEIAKAFTDAMNRISEANAADHERDILLDEIESTFYGNVDDLSLTEDDVGRVAALVYSKSNPKWTAKDIEQFMQAMTVTAKTSARVVNAKSLDEVIDIAVDSISDALAKSVPQVKGNTKSDEDSIMEFLKHLK